MLAIDTFGPLPTSPHGYKYVFAIVCCFTTFVELVPSFDNTAVSAANALLTVFGRYGIPYYLRSDNAPNFTSNIIDGWDTAVLTLPLGIAAAIHLEEFADKKRWFNRLIELNVQNLAAVPAIIYGLLALGFLSLLQVQNKNIVIGGALALSLLILPVIIISTREGLRSVPNEIRDGSLALGATKWQTVWRQVLPASVPSIATGSILALSRALGEAAPLLVLGALVYITFDPNGLMSGYTTLPIQIFNWTGRPQEGFHELAAATSVLLLGVLLLMNALAIFIRNKYQKRW
jgi:phosphate transport system permease protein